MFCGKIRGRFSTHHPIHLSGCRKDSCRMPRKITCEIRSKIPGFFVANAVAMFVANRGKKRSKFFLYKQARGNSFKLQQPGRFVPRKKTEKTRNKNIFTKIKDSIHVLLFSKPRVDGSTHRSSQ